MHMWNIQSVGTPRITWLVAIIALTLFAGCNDRRNQDRNRGFEFRGERRPERIMMDITDSLNLEPGLEIESKHLEREFNNIDESDLFLNEAEITSVKPLEITADTTLMVDALKNVLKTTKTSYELHFQLGNLYLAQKKYTDAKIEFEKALELNPASTRVQLRLSGVIGKQGSNENVINAFQEALDKFPGSAYLLKGLADTYRKSRRLDDSIKNYELAIKAAPEDDAIASEYHRTLGMRESNNKEFEKAAVEYQKAIGLKEDNKYAKQDLWLTQSRIFRSKGKFKEAAEEAAKVMELFPNSTPGLYAYYYSLGMNFRNLKEYAKAIDHFKKVLELMPGAANAHNAIGICYYMTSRFDEAIHHLQKATELNPDSAQAHYYLAKVYESKEWTDMAVEQWKWCKTHSKSEKMTEEANVHLYLLEFMDKSTF